MESHDDFARFSTTEIFESCLGCKWTVHVIAQIRAGIVRPGELERTAEGLTTKVLNERLTKLSRFGMVRREAFPEVPPRVEYHLTEFGLAFVKVLDDIDAIQQQFGEYPGTGG